MFNELENMKINLLPNNRTVKFTHEKGSKLTHAD